MILVVISWVVFLKGKKEQGRVRVSLIIGGMSQRMTTSNKIMFREKNAESCLTH